MLFLRLLSPLFVFVSFSSLHAEDRWHGIQVIDEATGRGIPLVELRTVNDIRCVTDNAGWIAFQEPGLMTTEVYFHVSSPGYDIAKDGFGYKGSRIKPIAGGTSVIKMKRTNLAERLGRLTGQGLYRDTELLGKPHPLPNLNPGGVMGQDSIQAVPYEDRIFYLWGDTNVPNYPLGNYRTTCASTPRNAHPERGLAYEYHMDPAAPKRLRKMMPLEGEGAVWMFGLLNLETDGTEQLFAHYGRHPGLAPALEQGIARFNKAKGVFESVAQLNKDEKWRFPRGHPVRVREGDGDWFYFSLPFLHTRVKATVADLTNPASYEAYRFNETEQRWQWQKELPPTTPGEEAALIKAGKLPAAQAHFQLKDVKSAASLTIHGASIQWNPWRKRWILIGTEFGGKEAPSHLGEVWYAESPAPHGPWTKAIKIVSHPRYSYYNPIHHVFFNTDGGRIIYFEGTYTLEFSGNPIAPARYDYNQLMYRLDLQSIAPALDPPSAN